MKKKVAKNRDGRSQTQRATESTHPWRQLGGGCTAGGMGEGPVGRCTTLMHAVTYSGRPGAHLQQPARKPAP